MAAFRLQIISQTRLLFDGDVISVIVPGLEGYFGVLAHHAPMLAALGKGTLTVRESPIIEHKYEISGGFFEVQNNTAVLLPDTISGFAPSDESPAQ